MWGDKKGGRNEETGISIHFTMGIGETGKK